MFNDLAFQDRTFERCKVSDDTKTLPKIIDSNETLSRSISKNIDLGSRDFVELSRYAAGWKSVYRAGDIILCKRSHLISRILPMNEYTKYK